MESLQCLVYLALVVNCNSFPFTNDMFPSKIAGDFNACFQASMMKVTEEDDTLAHLVNPQTDISIVAASLPKPNVNYDEIPTEFVEKAFDGDGSLLQVLVDNNISISHDLGSKNTQIDLDVALTLKPLENGKIRYLLFTKENKNQYQVLPADGSIWSKWRPERKTKILIHGLTSTIWLSPLVNIWSQYLFEIKNAYLMKSADAHRYNVIVVDWTSLSTVPLSRYPDAALATKEAGEDLAKLLIKLKDSYHIQNWGDVHLLGHSLGAHVAGIAGNILRKYGQSYMLHRITGLDPAGLCFDTNSGTAEDLETMLDTSDAYFVDIIHTNMGNIVHSVAGRYGSQMQTGHADFYPNGGEVQPGCNFLGDRLDFCSHQKSVVFFAKSIWDTNIACPCSSWDIFRSNVCNCNSDTGGYFMGEHCKSTARGKFFLNMSL